jgi:hypothetical protein
LGIEIQKYWERKLPKLYRIDKEIFSALNKNTKKKVLELWILLESAKKNSSFVSRTSCFGLLRKERQNERKRERVEREVIHSFPSKWEKKPTN